MPQLPTLSAAAVFLELPSTPTTSVTVFLDTIKMDLSVMLAPTNVLTVLMPMSAQLALMLLLVTSMIAATVLPVSMMLELPPVLLAPLSVKLAAQPPTVLAASLKTIESLTMVFVSALLDGSKLLTLMDLSVALNATQVATHAHF